MKTLDDAWQWYQATLSAVALVNRLAAHWDGFAWALAAVEPTELDGRDPRLADYARLMSRLRRDTELGRLESVDMRAGAGLVQAPLEDLAILILFSVFEAEARGWIADRLRPEVDRLADPTLKHAGEDVLETVLQGSFARVVEPYKGPVGHDLTEQVNQVRKYRNWVAHGRRDDMRPKENVTPRAAYERLTRFLAALRAGPATSPPSSGAA